MLQVFAREVASFLHSLIAYMVMILFLVALGLYIWVYPESNVLDYGVADLQGMFVIGPFIFLFLVPAITMKSFAEEKRTGTLEFLLTKPLTEWQIVVGKYLGSLSLVFVAMLPTLVYYISIYSLGLPKGNIDSAAFFGSWMGLLLLGSLFCSLGLLCSSLFDSQIVSFISAAFIGYVLYQGFGSLSKLEVLSSISIPLMKCGIEYHYIGLSKGLIDTRNIAYFLGLIIIFLAATRLSLLSRKW